MQRSFVPYNPGNQGLAVPSRKPTAAVGVARPGPALPAGRPGPSAGAAISRHNVPVAAVAAPGGAILALLGFYVTMHTGLGGEIFKLFLHIPFPVVGIFAVIVPLVIAFTGKLPLFFKTPVAKPWLLLFAWMMMSALLSFYPRESVSEAIPYALRFQILPFLFCAAATTSQGVRKLLTAAAIGMFPILLLCFVNGQVFEETRFAIPDTSLQNPNDLAFLLLWGSVLLLSLVLGKGKLGKIAALIAIPSCFWFILKTASRANFFTIFAVVAVAVIIAAPSVRIFLLIGVPIGLAVTLPLLPKATLDRILSVVVSSSIDEVGKQSSAATDAQLQGAIGSEAARMELAKLAIDATFRHPVFGVGMAMFANETADYYMRAVGKKAPWQTAHNSYLKVSSENGIPGLIFYVWAIVTSIGMTWSTFKKSRGRPGFEDANRNSVCILLALVVYAVGTFFCDIVYLSYLSISVGLAAANYLAFRNEDQPAGNPAPVAQTARFGPGFNRAVARSL